MPNTCQKQTILFAAIAQRVCCIETLSIWETERVCICYVPRMTEQEREKLRDVEKLKINKQKADNK